MTGVIMDRTGTWKAPVLVLLGGVYDAQRGKDSPSYREALSRTHGAAS